ncbi:MAG: tol-pal system protein YbgF [Gammaproteobacteria bacterium]|nr:tol-pal system protein YbgF [Gammaproteobacteria bacterium]
MSRASIAATSKILVVLLVSIFGVRSLAQGIGSIVESQGIAPADNGPGSPNQNNNSDALSLLLEQNQQLRTEVQALRGLVEEQGFEIRKMQRESLGRYTNLDDRLISIESGNDLDYAAPISSTIDEINSSSDLNPIISRDQSLSGEESRVLNSASKQSQAADRSSPAGRQNINSRGTLQPAVLSEQQLYQMAYDSVINSNFERSIAEFDQYMNVYPDGRFVTNAYYWQGQAYLYLTRYSEAKDSYEIILDRYKDSAKLPDAMYGLGLAYQGLGNITQARQLLTEIKRRFPNTGVANLADTKLLQLD